TCQPQPDQVPAPSFRLAFGHEHGRRRREDAGRWRRLEHRVAAWHPVGVRAAGTTDPQCGTQWACALAGPDDRIVLVHAWQMPVVAGYDMVLAVDPAELTSSATEALDELVAQIDDPRVVPVVRQGHAGRALIEQADAEDAAMIVMGHTGNSRVGMMLGSTANYVVHHTKRPGVIAGGGMMEEDADVRE